MATKSGSADYTNMEPEPAKKSSVVKYIVFAIIIAAIAGVAYDVFSSGCTLTEKEQDRVYRITCGGGNSTTFTCVSDGDSSWTETVTDGVHSCTKKSACVNYGITTFLSWMQENPLLGGVAFAGLYILACVFFIPGSLLTIGAGVAYGAALGTGYGVLFGTLCVWIGSNTGAALAFLLGRYLFRDWVAEQVKKVKTLTAIDKAIRVQGFKTVLLLRFSPVIPFNLFNYLMGATGVAFPSYVAGSLLGMLPGTTAYVFIGAALGGATSSNDLTSCNPDRTVQNIVLVVGVIATFAAVALISFYAKRELDAVLEKDEEEETAENKA